MEGLERFDATVNVIASHQPAVFAEFFGVPRSAFRIGETVHVLQSSVVLAEPRSQNITVEEALGVDYVAD